MPDLRQPGSNHFTIAHSLFTVAGIIGVTGPASVAVEEVLGPLGVWAVWFWSSIFITCGLAGLVSRVKRWYRAETVAVSVVAGGVILWAVMILYATGWVQGRWLGVGTQIGVAMIAMALFMDGWATYRRHRVTMNWQFGVETKRQIQGE